MKAATSLTISAAALVAALISACGGGSGSSASNTSAATNDTTAVANATVGLYGTVIDSASGARISGATVSIGGQSATTKLDGAYGFTGLTPGTPLLTVQASGYLPLSLPLPLSAYRAQEQLKLGLQKADLSTSFDASQAQTLVAGSTGAAVILPAAALVGSDGKVPTGAVTLSMGRIDPGADPMSMPGNYSTADGSKIESFGAVSYRFTDSNGQALNLASSARATIRIPLATGATSPPATVPLWAYNESTGRWAAEGTATLTTSGSQRWYEGQVSHFSTWNADQIENTVTITVCVVNGSGQPVAGVRVGSAGKDYSGVDLAVTGADGCTTVRARQNSTVRFFAQLNGISADEITLQTGTTNQQLPSKLVVPEVAGLQVSFGTPVTSKATADYGQIVYPRFDMPYKLSGVSASVAATLKTSWQITSPSPICMANQGSATYDNCVKNPPTVIIWNPLQTDGTFIGLAQNVASDNLSGTLYLTASLHGISSTSFEATLVVDVPDPVTGKTVRLYAPSLHLAGP